MPTYRYAGLILAADFSLPELLPAVGRPFMTITTEPRRRTDTRRDWLHAWRQPGGGDWMRVARDPGGYVVQFPRTVEFTIGARRMTCAPRVGVPVRTVRHLLLDQLLPAMLASRSRFVLHASAVAVRGRAVGFVGSTGAGKSTLAAALSRSGASTLTDDALVIDIRRGRATATPVYPGLRLWPESRALLGVWPAVRRARVAHYNTKQRWFGATVPFAGRPAVLDALYLLARGRRLRVEPLSRQDAVMALIRYSMMLDVTDRAAVRRGFDLAARLVEDVPVVRLEMPRGARGLSDACDMLTLRR